MPYQNKPGKSGFQDQYRSNEKRERSPSNQSAPGQVRQAGKSFEKNPRGFQQSAPRAQQSGSNQSANSRAKEQRYGRSAAGAKPDIRTGVLRNTDRGFEESTYSNQQYDRSNRRGGPSTLQGSRPGQSSRFGRPAFSQDQQDQRGTPASLRFGPGSRTSKPFGRPAPKPFPPARPVNAPVKIEKQVETPVAESYSEEDLPQVNLLTGRNPIREAIKTGRDLEKLMIAKGELSGSAREIVSLAKKAGIMIQSVERTRLDQLAKNHQGMIAFASAYQYATVEDILETAKQRKEEPFIILLDQITDPHNLGAVIRTAACAGAHGVIVPLHRAVGLTPAAVKASAGAVEHIKVARVTNLNQTIQSLQKQGIWFYAAQTEGEDFRTVQFTGPCALVIGSEGEGVSQLTASICDKQIRIPMLGQMNSLNASVAAGILMYAVFGTRNPHGFN